MINVRALANATIQNVNPNLLNVIWKQSSGYATDAAGKRAPSYKPDQSIQAQVQGINGEDQRHIEAMNLTGVFRSVHIWGNAQSNVRVDARGGDILSFPQFLGTTNNDWLIVHVDESWDTANWCRVIVMLQQ